MVHLFYRIKHTDVIIGGFMENNSLDERYLQIDGKCIFEADVEKMTLDELQDLLSEVDTHERTVSAKKKDYLNTFLDKGNREQFNRNMNSFRKTLDAYHEAQKWISSAKKQKQKAMYKDNQINKSFVELARKELKEKVFTDLLKRAKEFTI